MDRSEFWDKVIEDEISNFRRMKRIEFWDNLDKVIEDEIRNLRRMKFVHDVAPLEIIDDKEDDEDFINANANANASAVAVEKNINQIDLVIHIINHEVIYQYWSLKSEGDSSSSCHHQHHRDRHHLRDDDVDEQMIMIACQSTCPPEVTDKLFVDIGCAFASHDDDDHHQIQNVADVNKDDDHAAADDDDYIMSLLNDVDVLYELEILRTYEQLEEVKRCITQRISEAKPAIDLMAKPPKTVRIRVHLGDILKKYYANSAAATYAAAHVAFQLILRDKKCALHFPPPQPRSPVPPQLLYDVKRASRSSKEALETKIFDKGDLISPSSCPACPVCYIEFSVGVHKIMKMPCSHVFHPTCLEDWLEVRNTCPLCFCELPTWKPPKKWIRYI